MIKAFTDHPIPELGDDPHQMAPIRECTITGYDSRSYLTVVVDGVIKALKHRHVYSEKGRKNEVPGIMKTHKLDLLALV